MSEPYNYSCPSAGIYHFSTKNNINYSVLIADYSDMFGLKSECKIVFLTLYPIQPPAIVPFDRRVADTTSQIIFDYLDANRDIILYVCSAVDNHEETRANLFDRWHNKFNDGSLTRQIKFIEEAMHYQLQ